MTDQTVPPLDEVQPPDVPLDEAPFVDDEGPEEVGTEEDEEAPADADPEGEAPAEPVADGGTTAPASSSFLPALDQEPFEWDQITVTLVIQYLPHDGDPAGRQVVIGVRNSKDSPLVRVLRESEIGELPEPIQELLAELRASLPNRQLRSLKEKAKATPRKSKPAAVTPPTPVMPGTEAVPVVPLPTKPVTVAPAALPKPKPEAEKAGQISMF